VTSDFALRVLVTGATGFIGQRLIRRLVKAGAEVWAGVFPQEDPERARVLPTQARRLPLDVTNVARMAAVVERSDPEVVFHLAAVGVTEPKVDPMLAVAVNVGGTVRLLEMLRARRVRRIVLAGTCYEYGARETQEGLDPFNVYAASKVAAWAFARAYWRAFGLPVVVARLFQVYGPGQPAHTLVPAAIRAALSGEDFPMTPGEQRRDFVYVDDVVEGLLAAAAAPGIDGESVDLGTGVAYSVREVVERIWVISGARGRVLAGALPYRPGEVMHLIADADRTAHLTDWRATVGLEEGLRKTMAAIGAQADTGGAGAV